MTATAERNATRTQLQQERFAKRWRQRFMIMSVTEDREFTEEELAADCRQCERWRDNLISSSPVVRFMVKELAKVGCPMRAEDIPCLPCDNTQSGGFDPVHGITLCQNRFINKSHMEETLVHEMVHAYDHCKFKVNWFNLRHHACSEIRAASLSGDCGWLREMSRGNFRFTKQFQTCVKRRAIISVEQNPACPSPEAAKRAVQEVFDSCFNDTQPFDEIY